MNLFEGEIIDFSDFPKISDSINITEDKINQKYIKGEVRIVTEQARYPLNTISQIVGSENYKIHPDFQRRHRWDNIKKSRLIESFIMNVPVPPIFLYEVKFSYYEVMDGLQRLSTINDFYNDKFSLEGLEEWPELNGYTYSKLPEQIRRGVDRRYISSIILLQETAKTPEEAKKMKQMVFERINSGGVKLEDEETRNALYDGPMNQLCIELSRNPLFCKLWCIPEIDISTITILPKDLIENKIFSTMQDVELVLRFFAFRHLTNYQNTLKSFLDYYQQKANLYSPEILDILKNLFHKTIELVYEILGNDAFKIWRSRNDKWFLYNRPTKVFYDPVMYVFSEYIDDSNILIKNRKKIITNLKQFFKDKYSIFEGRSNNRSDIQKRFESFSEYIKEQIK